MVAGPSPMSEVVESTQCEAIEYAGVYHAGVIHLSARVDWPDGTPVVVRHACREPACVNGPLGKVIIAGFGLAGRWIAEIFDRHGIEYVVVEKNPETVEAQRKLGIKVVEGNISDEQTLRQAGIEEASILALTVPDEKAVLDATRLARSLKPQIYIVARTQHTSAGMQASQLGANDVLKGEQVVARQFYELLLRKISATQPSTVK